MKIQIKTFALISLAGLALAGCVQPKTESKTDTVSVGKGSTLTTADTLDVMVFEGGFGKDFFAKAAEEYGQAESVKVDVIGDPRIDESLKARFLEGNPPSLAFPGWRFDHWRAVNDGLVLPLDEQLKTPAWNSETPWGETFIPSLLKLGQKDGKQYAMPYFYSILGWWYDPVLFAQNGWEPPKNYLDLLALCQKIKAKGIAPITYQGKYPDYMIAGMLIPWVISSGGIDQFNKMQNLEPGAWNSNAVKEAAKMIANLRAMEYFQRGATAMDHTEAQTQFITGKAAMIPCGTWLYSEMQNSMPAGKKMEFMLPPVITDGKGDKSAIMIKIEPWIVTTDGKNQEHAIGYFKYLTSLEKAKQFVEEKGTFVAVKGSDEVALPDHLKTAATQFKASKTVWAQQWKEWYPGFYSDVENLLTRLLNGELKPDEFAAECEKAATKVREDESIPKFKVE